ncbi:MAG TPA: PAS domain S-box protein [Spirochaetota bacterium]|nr:PAS domain S-box protein [Spirochaetota bacterium]HNT12262.1 PAS domain S-box protein [Spirochaetota bacterium]HPI22798.1 PAS domain S-box protein [Spirochaetota bacterium]HPU87926.1 PAS domain S-box protein [Spirochaetota bacterium]
MNPLSLITFFTCIVYVAMGIYAIRLDRGSRLNRVFLMLCLSFAVWSLAYTFIHSAHTKDELFFWNRIGSIGWSLAPPLLLAFVLILTKNAFSERHAWFKYLLFLPTAPFIHREFTDTLTAIDFVRCWFGWGEVPPADSPWYAAFYVYYTSYFIMSIFLLLFWSRRAPSARERSLAHIIAITGSVSFGISIVTDTVLPAYGLNVLPAISPMSIIILALGMWQAIDRYQLMRVTPEIAAGQIIEQMQDLLVLADTDGTVLQVNPRTAAVIGTDEPSLHGRPVCELFRERELVRAEIEAIRGETVPGRGFPAGIVTAVGETVPVNVWFSPIRSAGGAVIGIAIIAHDLRSLHRLHEERTEREITQLALRQSEDLFRTISENMRDLVVLLNADGSYEYVSASHAHLGYRREDLMGMSAFDLVHPDDVPAALAMFRDGFSDGRGGRIELRFRRADGTYAWLECDGTVMTNESGARSVLVASREIDDRKAAEKALSASEERYRTIVETIEDGYYEVDLKGDFTFCNGSMYRMLGYEPGALIGLNYRAYMDGENSRRIFTVFNRVFREGRPVRSFDWELIRRDGERISAETSVSLITDHDGAPRGFRGVVRDITERKRFEARLRESEERYKQLVTHAGDVIISFDALGFFTYLNPTALARMQCEEREILGRHFSEFVHPDYRDEVIEFYRAQYLGRIPSTYNEHPVVARDGTVYWIGQNVQAIFKDDAIVGFQGIARDITERRAAEEKLWQNEIRLRLQHMALATLARTESLYAGDLKGSFRAITTSGAHNLDIERSSIWLFDRNRTRIICYDSFAATHDSHRSGWEIAVKDFPEFFDAIERDRLIDATDAAADERTRAIVARHLARLGIGALLAVPFRLGGMTSGILSLEHVGPPRLWTPDEENFAGSLSDFASLALESYNRRLAEEALRANEEELRERNEIIESDIKNAQLIHQELLPSAPPRYPGIACDFRNASLEAVGGDYFSFTTLQEGGLGVFIGDISGHGVSAALFITLVKATADRICRAHGQNPLEFIRTLNRDLADTMANNFLTAIYGYFQEIGRSRFRFTFSRGGHPHPLLYRAATGSVEMIKSRGTIIGKFDDFEFTDERVDLATGDRVFLFTDGLPETRNERYEIIGYDDLPALFERLTAPGLGETLDRIIDHVREFRGFAPIEDDLVIIGFEIV